MYYGKMKTLNLNITKRGKSRLARLVSFLPYHLNFETKHPQKVRQLPRFSEKKVRLMINLFWKLLAAEQPGYLRFPFCI